MKLSLSALLLALTFAGSSYASESHTEELNPFASDIEEQLLSNDDLTPVS